MPNVILLLTRYAKEKMVVHGITRDQIKIAIERGAKIRQTDGFLASYAYIKVAYKKTGVSAYKIKTVFIG